SSAPTLAPRARPHQPGNPKALAVAEEALLIAFHLHDVEEPIPLPRDLAGVPLARGGMPFGVFLDIKVQAPEVLHFRKDPFVQEPALQAPAPDTFVLEDGIRGNADGFQQPRLRRAPPT